MYVLETTNVLFFNRTYDRGNDNYTIAVDSGVFEGGQQRHFLTPSFFLSERRYYDSIKQYKQLCRFKSIIKYYQACARTIVVRRPSAKKKFKITRHMGEIRGSICTVKMRFDAAIYCTGEKTHGFRRKEDSDDPIVKQKIK